MLQQRAALKRPELSWFYHFERARQVCATLVGFSGMMSAFSSFDLHFVAFQDDNQYFKCINLKDFNKPMKLVEHYNQ